MSVRKLFNIGLVILLLSFCFCTGCVQRKLTIVTEPAGALVTLNDEEIGESPVTVAFEWYGDYVVRISKEGYQTLNTHRDLKRPLHDYVGFDLFAETQTNIDEYTWDFTLEPLKPIDKGELVKSAVGLKKQAFAELPAGYSKKQK
ncbi:MAG: PEGA domain-containing protein [Sedimentisphaerales bacterium]|nr:PEGA domain-containing protein [Sedimentisphaerales bacterium]